MSRPTLPDAYIEHDAPDPWGAVQFLATARKLSGDAANEDTSPEGRQILVHTAVMTATDALLAIYGQKVVGSEGGHRLRLDTAASMLPGHDELFDQLDEVRVRRHQASYAAAFVELADLKEALSAAADFIALVDDEVQPQLPKHFEE